MKYKTKIVLGIIACFTIFTLIFGLCGIHIEGSFTRGILVGLFVDVIMIGIIGIVALIMWMLNLKP